jgi:hypothetical protein
MTRLEEDVKKGKLGTLGMRIGTIFKKNSMEALQKIKKKTTGPISGLVPVGRGGYRGVVKESECMEYYVFVYENGKNETC